MYAFQCIASELLSDQLLRDLSFLRIKHHFYSLYDIRFTMTTSLSKSPVQARLYLMDTNQLHDIQEQSPFTDETLPFVMVMFGPSTPNATQWKDWCKVQGVPYFHRMEQKEMRDELYVRAISWLIYLVK